MEDLDELVQKAVSQVRNAFVQHDLEILGSFVLTMRDAYIQSELPFDVFCTTFGVPIRSLYSQTPPLFLNEVDRSIGVGIPSSFTRDLPESFSANHRARVENVPQGETKYTLGLFVPLDG